MREVKAHKGINKLNDMLICEVGDDPAPLEKGGGHASYHFFYRFYNESQKLASLKFHAGPLGEGVPPGGVSNEALLAVVIDRLRAFQKGAFSCRESALALTHLETALLWLRERARERKERGVEGDYKP
jgi:hypothetical protein